MKRHTLHSVTCLSLKHFQNSCRNTKSILSELLDDLGLESMLLPISNPAAATDRLLSDSLNL